MRRVPRDEWVLSTKVGRLLRPRVTLPQAEEQHYPMPLDAAEIKQKPTDFILWITLPARPQAFKPLGCHATSSV
jgi:hypothetical protein